MNQSVIKVIGIAIACFSLGIIVQFFISRMFVIILCALILLAVGILLIKC